ncbi:FkbM family methyltransferase [Candidatus Gracilibacteria bacterium]|nr:FkbM family methyltransferase [Candidatus Gracilibacteria bacterium]
MEKYNKALRYEIFENREYGFLDEIIKNSKIIFDIGGHVGYFTEYCLGLNQDLLIHFFEPVKDFLDEAKNRLRYENIYWNNSAIMNKNGFHNFFVNQEKNMQSSIFNQTFLNPEGTISKIIIKRLDDYIDDRKFDKIHLVKMDIEGSEFDVIQSLGEKHLDMIENLCIEYHILDRNFENKFDLIIDKLKNNYKNLDIMPSIYTDKVGYIFARK